VFNPQLLFMNTRFKTTALETILQLTFEFCDEEKLTKAKVLLFNNVTKGKSIIKREGVGKARGNLKDIFAVADWRKWMLTRIPE